MDIALSLVAFLLFFNFSLLPVLHGQLPLPINSNIVTQNLDVYIVHVQKPSGTKFHLFKHRKEWYKSFLPNVTLFSGEPRLVYAYRLVITGFAAWLTRQELAAMESKNGFLLADRDDEIEFRTTYTPKFLGLELSEGVWYNSGYGQGQIIGVIDSGVTPSHPSFSGKNIQPAPDRWNGNCYWGKPICNDKLIGAKAFLGGLQDIPPIDTLGHGTHTSSIAAGNFVSGANVLGNAQGMAAGIAPKAHVAMYKINGAGDLLKAIEEGISDNVDVFSMSLGDRHPDFHINKVVIGSFAAITKNIVPCAAAPNNGPSVSGIDNDAPWIITVGAASTDRKIAATVKLGDTREFVGESAYQPSSYDSPELPLVLSAIDETGKIVLRDQRVANMTRAGILVRDDGGAAMVVLGKQGNTTAAQPHVLPASHVREYDGQQIRRYAFKVPDATGAIIFNGTLFGAQPAPAVATFSGRGPSLRNGGIIKPDVIAPGVNILAAWPYEVGPNHTGTHLTFNFESGTSMATPHVAGVAALLRCNHPEWSTAAIQSAIMTTAHATNRDGKPIEDQSDGQQASVFATGSGHIDPVAANDPGLIYDIKPHDYIRYLCGSGLFTNDQVNAIVQGNLNCSSIRGIKAEDLNYPSIGVSLGADSVPKTVTRTVTNVGEADTSYTVDFDNPKGVNIVVSPPVLHFTDVGEKKSFNVTLSFKSVAMPAGEVSVGQLSWDSGKHLARSPIAVSFT